MMKRWVKIAAVFIIILTFAIPLVVSGCNSSGNTSGTESHAIEVVRADLRTTVSAFGSISMPHQARLSFAIGGGTSNISQINVKFGDSVKKGDVLARLNISPFDRAVSLATYDVRLARLALDALAYADNQEQQQQILLDKARIALDEAKAQRSGANITAPFAGVITEVGAMVGDYVTAGTTIFILVDTNQTEAIAMIDEVDVNRVAAGQTAMITLDAIPGVVINGTVKAISPQATIAAGVVTYKASVEISPEAGIQLRDGMTVRVDIVVANKINVLVVPNAAITKKGSDRVVEVALDGGKTEERVVTIGVSDATSTEILSGLQAGERVMVPGN